MKSLLQRLYLEFDHNWQQPKDMKGDVMLLAGDMVTFHQYKPLKNFLANWTKLVVYIAGNHEYYDTRMQVEEKLSIEWIENKLLHVHYLKDSAIEIDGVHFLGGTMFIPCLKYGPYKEWLCRPNRKQISLPSRTTLSH